jgi:hypothetical protein
MEFGEHTVICTYRVRKGARDAFAKLLGKHWPALSGAGLVTGVPSLIFESKPGGGPQDDEPGPTFVEIFTWVSAEAPDIAHRWPAIMAVWEPMGALVESRDGRPAMEFPHYRHIAPA